MTLSIYYHIVSYQYDSSNKWDYCTGERNVPEPEDQEEIDFYFILLIFSNIGFDFCKIKK